jgi:hypothetical protein
MTLFILDPNLENEHGHHLNWDLSIAEAALDRGEDVVVYANRAFAAGVPQTVKVVPYFSYSTYLRRSEDRITGRFDDFRYFNDILAEELEALPRGMFAATDVVLVPTLSEIHLLAYVSWAKRFDPVAAPLFVIHLMFPSGVSPAAPREFTVVDPLQALFYRLAFDIADKPGAPIYFFGGGRQIAREFSCLTGRTIEPHPVPIRPQRRRPASRNGRRVALLYAGDAKIEKGIHLLPELAARLCAAHPDWGFTAHVNTSTSWGEALKSYERLQEAEANLPNFRLCKGHLTRDAYLDLLSDAHCLVCTYDPGVYARKSSGVIWECISLGIPVLVPSNCWLEKEAEEWGAGYRSYSPYELDAICAQFDVLAADLASLEAKCADAARRYQSFNGAPAIIDQIGILSVPRFMAASLGGRPAERSLPLDQIAEPGWYGTEQVDGSIARWTAKEPHISVVWPFFEPWMLELHVDALAADDQLTGAEARVGDVRLATEAIIDRTGDRRLLIMGNRADAGAGAQPVCIALPYTQQPPGDTRELGVRVRRILLKPAGSGTATRALQVERIEVHSPVQPGPIAGSFLLQGTVSGIFWLEPHGSGEIRFSMHSTAGPDLVRTVRFYIDGQPAAMAIDAQGADEWLARVTVPSRVQDRRALRAEWDLALAGPDTEGEIVVRDLTIAGGADAPKRHIWTAPAEPLPLRMDAASRMLDETGFHQLEHDAAGNPFRWTRSESRFYFVVDRASPARFSAQFGGMAVRNASAGIRCLADGAPVHMEVSAGANNFQLSGLLPARPSAGGTTLNFMFPVSSPAESGSLDTRLLGAAFYWLQIEKAP